ncbi:MAG: hypothetical protein AW09_001469 [Candidatus Accumulibacter phosphatis]|uniref:Uncharacterized protein n=1 Tax=Candidatus Accumulibacter phosphatis TaxID=327160 RepID=A0A080LX73_9PROT|nr:MAG: hypothetical protein AW09_001469 [Candidatus Accumulibacter phosphatis]
MSVPLVSVNEPSGATGTLPKATEAVLEEFALYATAFPTLVFQAVAKVPKVGSLVIPEKLFTIWAMTAPR